MATMIWCSPQLAIDQETPPVSACIVSIIETSRWESPSPDPAGVTVAPLGDALLVTDSEVDEVAPSSPNLFIVGLDGTLRKTATTLAFSDEPTAISSDPEGKRLFFADDDHDRIFEVHVGVDEVLGTDDDVIRSFGSSAFGASDPEGLAYGRGDLFIADGDDSRVYRVGPGPNGVFDGPSPGSDDLLSYFDTSSAGVGNPEGIEFEPATGTLYVYGSEPSARIVQMSIDGRPIAVIGLSILDPVSPGDVTIAKASDGSEARHIYITDRGIDNGQDPDENDGRIYELSTAGCPARGELLLNGGFEVDRDNDGIPDHWEGRGQIKPPSMNCSGSCAVLVTGGEDGRLSLHQTIRDLPDMHRFKVSGRVNISPTRAWFRFQIALVWLDATGGRLGTTDLRTYTASNGGWELVSSNVIAPPHAATARLEFRGVDLKALILLDDFSVRP